MPVTFRRPNMPIMKKSYTLTVPESLTSPADVADLRRKNPSLSRSTLVSTFMGLIINQAKKQSPQGLVGLKNLGNTCFMNCIVQCLSNTPELRDYCLRDVHHIDINNNYRKNTALMEEFVKLTQSLWTSVNIDSVSPSDFRSQVQKYAPKFVGCCQQDAQEFLRFLLDGLHNEVNRVTACPKVPAEDFDHLLDDEESRQMWNRYLEQEDSKVVDLFVGQLKSSLTCTLRLPIDLFEPFWDLSIPIAQKNVGEVTLKDCLTVFTIEDVLDGDERPTCNHCKARRKCTKRFSIQKFPQVLVLHLKRFSDSNIRASKLSTYVNFPIKELDLREFASESSGACPNSTEHTGQAAGCLWNIGVPADRPIYSLYAVSNHTGNTLGGHYTAYCKNSTAGEWYSFNDTRVSPMSSCQVRSSNAYILFYELTTTSSHTKYQTCRL